VQLARKVAQVRQVQLVQLAQPGLQVQMLYGISPVLIALAHRMQLVI
jgi:hypothetical protein